MPWNGSGVFNRIYSWVADKAAGLDISSTRMDTDTNDIAANGFGNCITRDGQGQPIANLPMNNFRHTGVSLGTARTDYSTLGQAQDGQLFWTTAGGTADAITAAYTPSQGAPTDGQIYCFRATAANTSVTPTFAPNGQTAHTITRFGGAALQPGDIAGNLAEVMLRYNAANTRYELENPANPVNNAVIGGTSAVSVPNGTTGQRPGSPSAAQVRFNNSTSAFEGFDGTAWRNLNSPAGGAPNVQVFPSSSGTCTTPAGALYLVVEMVGGGGGGGGSGTGSSSGTAGGNTSFNSVTASGGAQGIASTTSSGQPGGAGGAAGTGTAAYRFPGQAGGPGGNGATGTIGGPGGSSYFGGGGPSGTATINPGAAQSNTGSGGGGGGPTAAPTGGGGGGGAGEYACLVIASPAASYSYSVGAAGGGGSGGGGTNGGAGASGVIIVTAYFQ